METAMMERLAGFAYLLGWKIVRLLPETFAYRIFQAIADRSSRKRGKSYLRLRENLRRVTPDLRDEELDILASTGMRSYLRYWCEAFRLPSWSQERLTGSVSIDGGDRFRDLVAQGRGVVVSLPHSGNWDHAGAYFSATGIPIISVAEKLRPERVFRAFLRYRERIGMRIYSAADNVIPILEKHLANGEVVALVADRDLSKNGVEVQFFNGVAKMPSGPALLALRNGSYLIVAHVTYTSHGIHIKFSEPLTSSASAEQEKIVDLIQQSARIFEEGIRQSPEDWHMLQKIWIR